MEHISAWARVSVCLCVCTCWTRVCMYVGVCGHAHRQKQDSVVFCYRATRKNTQNVYLSLSASHFATWCVRSVLERCCVLSETPINTLTSRLVVIPAGICRLLELMGSSLDRCWVEMRTCAFRVALRSRGVVWVQWCGVVWSEKSACGALWCGVVRGRVVYDAVVCHRVKTIQESAQPFKILLPHHSAAASSPRQPAALWCRWKGRNARWKGSVPFGRVLLFSGVQSDLLRLRGDFPPRPASIFFFFLEGRVGGGFCTFHLHFNRKQMVLIFFFL